MNTSRTYLGKEQSVGHSYQHTFNYRSLRLFWYASRRKRPGGSVVKHVYRTFKAVT